MSAYSLIAAICPYGYANEVMNSARSAGATGGTILNSRSIGDEKKSKFMGISLREEKEILITLVTNEIRNNILEAIAEYSDDHPDLEILTMAVPADNVVGIAKPLDSLNK